MTTDQTNISDQGERVEPDAAVELARLKDQCAQAQGDYQRVLADFANYQRRALSNEQVARTDGAARVASDVVTVIDHFDQALGQDLSQATPRSILDGMAMVREALIHTLARHGVTIVAPRLNDPFQPGRHEAVMQQAAEGVEPGNVAAMLQPGYAIATAAGERIIRPAKVSVAPSAQE